MIVICPKLSYYNALNEEVKSAVRVAVRKAVEEWAIGKPLILLEDTFAKALIGEMSECVTITDERDFSQMNAWHYYEDGSYMPSCYSLYPKEISQFIKFENPPVSLMVKDRSQYEEKRTAAYEKRLIEGTVKLAEKHKAALLFVGNSRSRNKFEPKPKEDDGILYITYNLSNNVVSCFYSGIWVDEVMAKQILGGLYG